MGLEENQGYTARLNRLEAGLLEILGFQQFLTPLLVQEGILEAFTMPDGKQGLRAGSKYFKQPAVPAEGTLPPETSDSPKEVEASPQSEPAESSETESSGS